MTEEYYYDDVILPFPDWSILNLNYHAHCQVAVTLQITYGMANQLTGGCNACN